MLSFWRLSHPASPYNLEPETTQTDPVAETDPYVVPLDDALSEMYSLMDDIYGPATRSSRPKIVSIETVTGSHYGDPDETVNNQPVQVPGYENDGYPGIPHYGPWTQNKQIGPLLTTEWHQWGPFNKEKSNRPAGCVTIAVAQIVAYNEKPDPSFFKKVDDNSNPPYQVTSTWHEIKNYNTSVYYDSEGIYNQLVIDKDLAVIIRAMARGMDAKYNYAGSGGTFIWPIDAEEYMKNKLGYNAVRHKGYDASVINKMLNCQRPVFIAAREKGTLNAHAWVIDGYLKQARTMTIKYSKSGRVEVLSGGWREFIHCNFGWVDDSCNGYYLHEIFNTNAGPRFKEAGEDATRSKDTGEYIKNFRIIEY